jgi:L-threonylcarbamoyladenylate synthase
LILDGGPTPLGLESTVVDLTSPTPRLLRPGALSSKELRASLPDLIIESGPLVGESDRHSPGQDLVHYAPKARLEVLPRKQAIARARGAPTRVGLILRATPRRPSAGPASSPSSDDKPAGLIRVLPRSPTGFGRELFATLHELDAADLDLILVESPPDDEAWLAVRDRLERASRRE